MISKILEELKSDYHLKKNHLSILNLLSAEECTADEICARTGIPKGRIYNLLNELINMRLIERKSGVPAVYSMSNPHDKIMEFLRYEFNKNIEKQKRLMSMLEEKEGYEKVEVIPDNESYDYELMSLLSESLWLKIIHGNLSIAWFIQPRTEADFWKVRQEINKRRRAATTPSKDISLLKYRSYLELYKSKPAEQIMTKEAFDSFVSVVKDVYGKTKTREWAREMLKNLEASPNVKLFVMDSPSSVFNQYISDKGVLSILIFRGDVTGIKIIGKRVVELYSKYFEELKSRSAPIQEHLKKLV